jgi:hypothetical protein
MPTILQAISNGRSAFYVTGPSDRASPLASPIWWSWRTLPPLPPPTTEDPLRDEGEA